jgi:hypothetical protein
MVLVFIVAASLAARGELQRRRQSFMARAEYHEAARRQLESECRGFCMFGLTHERIAAVERELNRARETRSDAIEYHAILGARYRAGAGRPWFPIRSDPPAPPLSNPRLISADEY